MSTAVNRHPSDEALQAYCLGRLARLAADSVRTHLLYCLDCRGCVAGSSTGNSVGANPRCSTPADVTACSSASLVGSQGAAAQPVPSRSGPNDIPTELAEDSRYGVIREFGRGGMGVVYLAHNIEMDRPEVLKILNQELLARRGTGLERFLREIRTAGKLNHPNIVTAYSTFELGNLRVFAMEYVQGQNLADLVKQRGALPVTLSCQFIYQAALGLQHAHEAGTIHRDIKPGNLMVARQGQKKVVKVLDFGLAKAMREGPVDSARTHEGQALGTPDYNAPEQIIDARNVDIRADIYSLGCTLHYLLTGQPPFEGKSLYDIYRAHISTEAMPLNRIRADVSTELAAVVGKMMAKDPAGRYQTPAAVAEALKPFCRPSAARASAAAADLGQPGQADGPELAAAPPPAPQPAEPWASLIDVGEPERSGERPKLQGQRRPKQPRTKGPAVAVGALAAACLVAWAVTITIRTRKGTVVLEDLPADAQVTVDGGKVVVRRPGGKPAEVTVRSGAHALIVKQSGCRPFEDEVTVAAGKATRVQIFLAELPKPSPTRRVDPSRFTIDQGQWIRQGDELLQADSRVWAWLLFGDPEWTDYDFSADLMRVQGTEGGSLVVRTTDKDNNNRFTIGGWGGTASCLQPLTGGSCRNIAFRHSRIENGKWYTARIRVRGSRIECSLHDGANQIVQVEDVDDVHPKGRVGLSAWYSAFRFKNIKVIASDGKMLWTGPPAIPSQPLLATTASPRECASGTVLPFNGKNLTGWDGFRGHEYAAAEQLFFVDHDELVSYPGNWGTLVTQDGYSDFVASFDFHIGRGEDAGASLITAAPSDERKWLECQIEGRQPGEDAGCGDVYAEEGLLQGIGQRNRGPAVYYHRSERPELNLDGWNTYEIENRESHFIIKVNGRVVNEAETTWRGAWRLGLRAEAQGSVRFRNLAIQGLDGKAPTIAKTPISPVTHFEPAAPAPMQPGDKEKALDALVVQAGYKFQRREFDSGQFGYAQYRWEFYPVKAQFVAREAFGRNDVLCTHPLEMDKPATIDFSALTKGRAGTLLLTTHSFPDVGNDGGRIVVKVDEKVVHDFRIGFDDGWKTVAVPFDDGNVVVEHHAVGWHYEYAFLDFAITARDNPRGAPKGRSARRDWKPAEGFEPLFNGQDLKGWKVDSGLVSSWRVDSEQGELVMTGPLASKHQGFLLTERQFHEFVLRLEFQPGPGANSGVSFWALPGEFVGTVPHPLEVELRDHDPRGVKNGAFAWSRSTAARDLIAPDKTAELKPADSWNALEVEARGNHLSVTINGRNVLQVDLDKLAVSTNAQAALWRRMGCIGLQSHSGTVRFRNIEIKELTAGQHGKAGRTSAFHSLFNGKDLTGWKVNPLDPVQWDVLSEGVIRSNSHGRIYTERSDYADFHVRAELMAEPNCLGAVYLRSGFNDRRESTYMVYVNTIAGSSEFPRSGSLTLSVHGQQGETILQAVGAERVRPGQWFSLEAIATGRRFVVLLDGKQVVVAEDRGNTYTAGHIALRRDMRSRGGELHCRKIEVLEGLPLKTLKRGARS